MKRYAKEVLVGTMQKQFGRLRSYAAEILMTNVGSTVIIASNQQVFEEMYICFNGYKMGFRNGCRKAFGVDGCHLRGCFGEDIENGNMRGWTLMTDGQKALQNVTNEMFLEAEHRFCVRHMYTNFFNKGHKGKTLKNYLWHAAKSTTVADYSYWMQQIRNISEAAYKWLIDRPPQEWSRSHFSFHAKSNILLNNVCEVFNKTLRSDREKMILTMLTSIQLTFMTSIRKRRDMMVRCAGRLCPKIWRKLNKNAERARECTLHLSGRLKWQVECSSGIYVVDLLERSCVCREWELTGIPCMHAVLVIRESKNEPEDYVDDCYTIETYMRCYYNILNPINGMRLWPEVDMSAIVPLSWVVPRKGKRQTNRRKGADEEVIVHSQDKTYMRKKGRLTMTCLICGLQGHNKRYHSRHDAPLDDWFEGELQQVGVQCNSYGTARGKMVVIGGKGASSVTHTAQNSPFHFMPAPTVKTDFATDCVALSPAITMPNLHQNERVHLVATNVPTVEVNFKEKVNDSQHMDEVKMLKIQPKRTRTRRSANTAQLHRDTMRANWIADERKWPLCIFLST